MQQYTCMKKINNSMDQILLEKNKELQASEQRFFALLQNLSDAVLIVDADLKICFCNQRASEVFELSAEQLNHSTLPLFPSSKDISEVVIFPGRFPLAIEVMPEKSFQLQDAHNAIFAEMSVSQWEYYAKPAYLITFRDITQKLENEKLQQATFQISQTANTAQDLTMLFRQVHGIVANLIPAKNLYIALYDTVSHFISFPYYVDECDYIKPNDPSLNQQLRSRDRKVRRGLTEYLLHRGEALLLTAARIEALTEAGEIDVVGSLPIEWLGIPLKTVEGKIIGGLVVQTYDAGIRYREKDKEILSFVSTQIAMTIERKQADEALKRERQLFIAGPVVVFQVRSNEPTPVKFVSPNLNQFGYRPEEFTNGDLTFTDIVYPDDVEMVQNGFNLNVKQNSEYIEMEYRIVRRDGQIRWVYDFSIMSRAEDGTPNGYDFYILDVTAREQAEADLKNVNETLEDRVKERTAQLDSAHRYLQTLLNTIPTPILSKDTQGVITNYNQSFAQFAGIHNGDYLGKKLKEVFSADLYNKLSKTDQKLLKKPGSLSYETKIRVDEANEYELIVNKATFLNPDGSIGGLVDVLTDITAHKRAEKLQKTLYRISEAANSSQNLDALFVDVHRIIGQLIPADNLIIALYDSESEMITFPYFVDENEEKPVPRKLANGMTEYLLKTGLPLLINLDEFNDLKASKKVESFGKPAYQWLGVPLKTDDNKIIGALIIQIYQPTGRDYTDSDKEILLFVSTQIAMAIERKRIQDELKSLNEDLEEQVIQRTGELKTELAERMQREKELETIVNVAAALRKAKIRSEIVEVILNQLLEVIDAEAASMGLVDATTDKIVFESCNGLWSRQTGVQLDRDSSASGVVLQTGNPYVNNAVNQNPGKTRIDVLEGLNCIMLVPLFVDDQPIGVLNVGRSRPWGDQELRILIAIAEMAASAMHRSRLNEQTERRLSQLQSLRTIDQVITGNLEKQVSMSVLLTQIVAQLRIDSADILIFNQNTNLLEFSAGCGFRDPNKRGATLARNQSLAEQIVLQRQMIAVKNLKTDPISQNQCPYLLEENFQAYFGIPLIAKSQVVGVLELFHRTTFVPDQDWIDFFTALAGQTAIAINNANLVEGMLKANNEMRYAYDATIEGWARALELRDQETEGHSQQVTKLTVQLAQAMGISGETLVHIRRGAVLHDIGKMGIPDKILLKPGSLDPDEWEVMRKHPTLAYKMLSQVSFLRPALDIPYCHHEKWDGTGYPRGLKGEEIPLSARIFSVVDVWHALTSKRPYHAAWKQQDAMKYIIEQAGSHFDPAVVDLFVKVVKIQPSDGPNFSQK